MKGGKDLSKIILMSEKTGKADTMTGYNNCRKSNTEGKNNMFDTVPRRQRTIIAPHFRSSFPGTRFSAFYQVTTILLLS